MRSHTHCNIVYHQIERRTFHFNGFIAFGNTVELNEVLLEMEQM